MKKTEKAMKLMQALSGVDEELLARSEERKPEHKIVRFMNRYGKECAACLCLLVAGAAFFAMNGLKTGNTSESIMDMAPQLETNMTAGGARDNSAAEAAPEETEGEETAREELAGAMNSCVDAGEAPVWLDIEALAQQTKHSAEQDGTENCSGAQNSVGLETAREGVMDEAVDSKVQVPDSYSYIGQTLSEDGESRTVEWSDGEHALWLRFTRTELTTDMRFDAEPPVYTVEEDWQGLIAEREAGERQQLALLYEDGLLVEYSGSLTKEELVALLESLL